MVDKMDKRQQHFLIGVPAWDFCGNETIPETHINIVYHLDWIKNYTQEIQISGKTIISQGTVHKDNDNHFYVKSL